MKLASLPRSFKSDESKALTDENLVDPAKPLKVRPELMFLDSFCDVPNKELAARGRIRHRFFLLSETSLFFVVITLSSTLDR